MENMSQHDIGFLNVTVKVEEEEKLNESEPDGFSKANSGFPEVEVKEEEVGPYSQASMDGTSVAYEQLGSAVGLLLSPREEEEEEEEEKGEGKTNGENLTAVLSWMLPNTTGNPVELSNVVTQEYHTKTLCLGSVLSNQ
ncbi:hypothetical protein JRQ81_012181 [Phrynocephalus forsythii]|uniref:Uncharacterized protein n=1 Tax=Phrynocephalus forsythii TaxID=171643 RepID=A0A9Q0X6A5_9SAUR|nr:hypothetical protein JRQ81_012181 [Phrynocephalus forsythii]